MSVPILVDGPEFPEKGSPVASTVGPGNYIGLSETIICWYDIETKDGTDCARKVSALLHDDQVDLMKHLTNAERTKRAALRKTGETIPYISWEERRVFAKRSFETLERVLRARCGGTDEVEELGLKENEQLVYDTVPHLLGVARKYIENKDGQLTHKAWVEARERWAELREGLGVTDDQLFYALRGTNGEECAYTRNPVGDCSLCPAACQ
jgi:hypothetical protein